MEEFGLPDLLLMICTVLIILKLLDTSGVNNREHPQPDETGMKNVTPTDEPASSPTPEPSFSNLLDGFKNLFSKTPSYEANLPHTTQLALDSIKRRDRKFTSQKFIELTMKLHAKVIQALNNRDFTMLSDLCYESAAEKLKQSMEISHQNVDLRSVSEYISINIIKAHTDSKKDYIVMSIVTQQIHYKHPDSKKTVDITDEWTISRKLDSTTLEGWKLQDLKSKETSL